MIELVEDTCMEPLPDGVRVYLGRFTGSPVAVCDHCDYMRGYWECACELVHDCGVA